VSASGRVIYFRPNSFQQLGDIGRDPARLIARFLIFVKVQAHGFRYYCPYSGDFLPGVPNLKGRHLAALSLPFRSVQDCNSSGSFAMLAAIRRASSARPHQRHAPIQLEQHVCISDYGNNDNDSRKRGVLNDSVAKNTDSLNKGGFVTYRLTSGAPGGSFFTLSEIIVVSCITR
jgi:hypothetical protein